PDADRLHSQSVDRALVLDAEELHRYERRLAVEENREVIAVEHAPGAVPQRIVKRRDRLDDVRAMRVGHADPFDRHRLAELFIMLGVRHRGEKKRLRLRLTARAVDADLARSALDHGP